MHARHAFKPTGVDVLESREVLSHFGGFATHAAAIRNVAAAHGFMFNNGSAANRFGHFGNVGLGSNLNNNPFNSFATGNGFGVGNGLTTNTGMGFTTGTVTGVNGQHFAIPTFGRAFSGFNTAGATTTPNGYGTLIGTGGLFSGNAGGTNFVAR